MGIGIRQFTNDTFNQYLPQREELGNAGFRSAVMHEVVNMFGISVESAATHYNFSLKQARIDNPASVKDLGRPVGKKGGRKPIHTVDVIKVKTGEIVATGISKGAAEQLIMTATAKKKAKLAIKVDAPDSEVTV